MVFILPRLLLSEELIFTPRTKTERVKKKTEPDITLRDKPSQLIMESDIPLESQCAGLPEKHYPTAKKGQPSGNCHPTRGEEQKVKPEGFSLIAYFSSILDSITGKEVDKAILDIGDLVGSTCLCIKQLMTCCSPTC